jgi:hypothetical protein
VRLGTIFVRKNVLEDVTGDALTCVEVFDVILQGVMSQSDTGVSQINKMHFCQWRGSLGAQSHRGLCSGLPAWTVNMSDVDM